jgi:hypothetical protein
MEDVNERVIFVRIREKPGPTQGRPKRRGVDRDDRAKPGGGVAAEYDLLVALELVEH